MLFVVLDLQLHGITLGRLWRFRRSFNTERPHVYWLSNRNELKDKAVQKYKDLYESFAR